MTAGSKSEDCDIAYVRLHVLLVQSRQRSASPWRSLRKFDEQVVKNNIFNDGLKNAKCQLHRINKLMHIRRL